VRRRADLLFCALKNGAARRAPESPSAHVPVSGVSAA